MTTRCSIQSTPSCKMLPVLLLLLVCLQGVSSQAAVTQSHTLDRQSLQDRALFLADALVNHPAFFNKLLKIIYAIEPLLDIGNHYPNVEFLKDHSVDILQEFVNNNVNGTVLSILADELHRVDDSDVIKGFQERGISPDDPEAKMNLTKAIFTRFDKVRALQRILSRQSAQYYLPLNPQDKISTTCYRHVINVIDALVGVPLPPPQSLTFVPVPWALHMLDASGRPRSGMLEKSGGSRVWAGSRGECERVHALLVPGVSLGNRTLTDVVNFHGQMCRASVQVPSFASSFLDQPGLESLQWDICVPDTCTGQEVLAVFNLGVLKQLDMNVTSVTCDSLDTSSTPAGHVTLVSDTSILYAFLPCLQQKSTAVIFISCFMSVFDRDGNGNVSLEEWSALDKRDNSARYFLSLDVNRNLQIDQTDLMYFFRFSDGNDDGLLNIRDFEYQWKSLIWSHPPADVENPEQLMTSSLLHYMLMTCNHTSSTIDGASFTNCFLRTFDKNNDGWVSRQEFVNQVPKDDSSAYFLLIDINHDLKIDPVDLNHLFSVYNYKGGDLLSLQWAPGFPFTE